MSQAIFSNIVPSTTSGNALATILNDFKDAVASGFSGTSRPSNLQAKGYWIDTTLDPIWEYKMYDGVSDYVVFSLNTSTGLASMASADSLLEIIKISNDSVGPIARLLKKRIAGSGQVQVGDTIGELQFYGTRDTGVTTLQARIKSISQNNVTATQQGAYLAFEITTLNGASIAEVMRLIDGKVGIGTVTPTEALHVYGNVKSERESDDTVAAKAVFKKKRIVGSGQVLSGDIISEINSVSTDNTGAELAAAQIEVSANETHTTTAHGTTVKIKNKKQGQTTYTTQVEINDVVNVKTDLVVDGNMTVSGTLTTLNTTNTDIKDANITLNKGGNQAAANSAKSGFRVEMSDATHAQIGYDSTKASKFVIGLVGSEVEVADVSSSQTFTNKILSGADIQSPVRADVKKDTEANLTTYATTAANGQWCFATDTKVMYQVIDTALVPAGAGGGGVTLNWTESGKSPLIEYISGLKLGSFDQTNSQELFAVLTVPQSYRAGKQIKLKSGQFFAVLTTGNVLFKTVASLIQSTSVLGTYPNQRTSTNTQVAVSGTTNTANSIGDLDLTDTSGQINGVSVAAGHKIMVKIFRDNASETSALAGDARLLLDSFEPTFS